VKEWKKEKKNTAMNGKRHGLQNHYRHGAKNIRETPT
jgi:hypothetical protein